MRREMVNSVSIAKYWTILKKSTTNTLMITSHVSKTKDNFIGQKWTPQLITPILSKITAIPMLLLRFFCKEHHDTPHVCSKCQSTIDPKFVYNFNCNVQ
jgi:hypothetical protein